MKDNTKKELIISGVACATILLIVLFIIVMVQFCAIAPLKKQKQQMQAKLEQILEEKEFKENAIDYISGNKFIEEYAREVLGYGREGEIKFVPKD